MRGSEVRFYADAGDMPRVLGSFNQAGHFVYTEMLSAVGVPLLRLDDAMGLIPHLRDRHPQPSKVFLVTNDDVEINSRDVVMRDGSGIRIKADQPFNPDAVLLKLGGCLGQDRVLVATSISSTAETSKARRLFQMLNKIVAHSGEHTDGFYVLPGALDKFRGDWRLTP